ncbi:MAG: hypothetical protein H6815_03165 [Phycisphaeraceae bacterium]|nr:hypothetical protein [Phycisphaerales bacterium]MCB9859428.1 hypothetical protein [Phycisphaeraceae bacterium]
MNAAMWDSGTTFRWSQAGTIGVWAAPLNGSFGQNLQSQVRYPSQKAYWYPRHAHHLDRKGYFFWYPQAKLPVLFADGSVSIRSIGDANMSMHPNDPLNLSLQTEAMYFPSAWQTPTTDGSLGEHVTDRIRFTRGGLKGRDFGGPVIVEAP